MDFSLLRYFPGTFHKIFTCIHMTTGFLCLLSWETGLNWKEYGNSIIVYDTIFT